MVHLSDHGSLLRARGGAAERVTPLELFFDLVYVFAVTQLSHRLLEHLGVIGALQTLLLLVVVWSAWVGTNDGRTPRPRSRVAQACLRSSKRISGRPARLKRGLKWRFTTF
jgi:hypothetical protein